jgi:hypothetical protein
MKRRVSNRRLTGFAVFIERLYRITHSGQIRTLVITDEKGNKND